MTPQELKNSILQLAIQGKLVEQRPEEGTAAELFAQIQEEKQRLIQEGKIKKEKPLPEITDDEKPFEIPESWMWVRLRNIVYNRGQLTPQCTFSYIDIGSIDNQRQLLNTGENIVEADKAPSRARKIVEQGDILYSTVRPYLHNMCIVDKQFSHKPIASTGFAVLNSVYTRSSQNSTPNSNATNLHCSQKRCCSFCISSSNASPTFQVQKSIFHQMTKPIQVTVILPLLLAISLK